MDSVEQTKMIIDDPHIRYKTIFENTGTATMLIEEDMTISMVNSELERVYGLDKSRIENKMKFSELVVESDREKVKANHRLRRRNPNLAPRNYACRVKVNPPERGFHHRYLKAERAGKGDSQDQRRGTTSDGTGAPR